MRELTENTEFAFLVGKVRCLESRLLHPSVFYQLAEASSLKDVHSILSVTPYHELDPFSDFESFMEENLLKEARELYEFSSLPSPVELFLWRWEIPHLKKLLRFFLLGSDVKIRSKVLFDPDLFYKVCETRNISLLPSPFSDWVRKSLPSKKEELLRSEISIERFFLLESFNTSFPLLKEYFTQEIDFFNLKIALRKIKNPLFSSISFIPHGLIPFYQLNSLAKGDIGEFIRYIENTPYVLLARDGLSYWKEKRGTWRIEMNFWELRLRILSPADYSPFLPESLFYYLLKKENEIRNLRWIIFSKSFNLGENKIKERLGYFHV